MSSIFFDSNSKVGNQQKLSKRNTINLLITSRGKNNRKSD